MLAQKTRYALRSLLYIAEDTAGAPVQLARIAETQRVPPKYLELIMLDLKKAGLVASTRGPRGGYLLTRDPTEISFGEIVRAMEGPIALVSCASVNFYAPCGDCQDEATCAIRRAFSILRDQSTHLLEGISLAEAAGWEKAEGLLSK
jgi:Rrf2 family protein